jgi:hypothetical protein
MPNCAAILRTPGLPGVARAFLIRSSSSGAIIAVGCERNLTWQEMQAWAQNLGHTSLTTTFGSYGQVAPHQQGKLVRNAGTARRSQEGDLQRLVTMVSEIHAAQTKG